MAPGRLTLADEDGPTSRVARLGEFDLPDRLAPVIPRWGTQLGVALLGAAAIEITRALVNVIAPGSAVFALIFPAIMVATLFARWFAGLLTAVISIGYTFFVVYLPTAAARATVNPRFAVFAIGVSAVLTIVLAEVFRGAVRRATQERDREIADRDLFLEEFDHRMKNNFAIVGSLLDLQRRRATEPATAEALSVAQFRVDSIARAHRHLYRGAGQPGVVEMRDYLADLSAALAESLFLQGGVTLSCDADEAAVPRDRAVSIGLVVNELVTNAAKHAFTGRDVGTITVTFRTKAGGGWVVTVSDDGIGMPAEIIAPGPDHGLGTRLIQAFARQAGGTLATDSDPTGTRIMLELSP